jgi:hypothetical protein
MKLNTKQKEFLKKEREKIVNLRLMVIQKYGPAIFDNIKQMRETVRNLSITSGAVATLSITLVGKSVIINDILLILAILIFLLVVWLGFFYLKIVLESENKKLSLRSEKYNKKITEVRKQIDKSLKNNSAEEAKKVLGLYEELEKVFREEPDKKDLKLSKYIGDLTLIPFTAAILLLIMAFIKLNLGWYLLFGTLFILISFLSISVGSIDNLLKTKRP